MKKALIVENGIVMNAVLLNDDDNGEWLGGTVVIVDADHGAGIGWTYKSKKLTAPAMPEPTIEELAAEARSRRNALLSAADVKINAMIDKRETSGLTEDDAALLEAWCRYRIALRAIPDQEGFPTNVTCPEKPE